MLLFHKFRITMMRAFSKFLLLLAPSVALKLTQKFICKPIRKPSNWPKQVKQFNTMTRHGKVRTYKYGSGKTIWLVHGWSGSAFQFWPLMQRLADKGFEVISFDLPGHGQSQGHYSSLPKMIRAFDDISASLLQPQQVITHALGASVVANSQWFKSYHQELFVIAPVLKYFELLQTKINKIGLDQQLFDNLIHHIYRREKMLLTELNSMPHIQAFTGRLNIIHDKYDTLSPATICEKLAKVTNAEVLTMNKIGHNKMLRSKTVLEFIDAGQQLENTA